MIFLAIKTEDGVIKGKISFYCRILKVTRQGFYKYLADKDRPWKYQDLADSMRAIASEDECNDLISVISVTHFFNGSLDEKSRFSRSSDFRASRMTVDEVKTIIWRYFISYWNNRRICSANEGLPPMVKRQRYYESLGSAA